MSSKEQSQSKEKSAVKQRSIQSEVQKSEAVDQQIHQAAILQRAKANPRSLTPRDVMQLHRTMGNQAVGRLLTKTGQDQSAIQRQVSPEDEEELVQGKFVQRQPEEEEELLQGKFETIQREGLEEEEEELMLKPDSQQVGPEGGKVPPQLESSINRARGGGQPLESTVQEQMSKTMGHDFSGVRVHTGSEADRLNQQLSAKAFTTGQDIFFKRGEYNTGTGSGKELITHELIHVVQQRTGQVGPGRNGLYVLPVTDSLEQAAHENGAKLPGRAESRRADGRKDSHVSCAPDRYCNPSSHSAAGHPTLSGQTRPRSAVDEQGRTHPSPEPSPDSRVGNAAWQPAIPESSHTINLIQRWDWPRESHSKGSTGPYAFCSAREWLANAGVGNLYHAQEKQYGDESCKAGELTPFSTKIQKYDPTPVREQGIPVLAFAAYPGGANAPSGRADSYRFKVPTESLLADSRWWKLAGDEYRTVETVTLEKAEFQIGRGPWKKVSLTTEEKKA